MNLPEGFNEEYYLWKYPDVKEAVKRGMLPSGAFHYSHYGIGEEREYKPTIPQDFTEQGYLACNEDIKLAVEKGQIPSGTWHWLIQGWKENRAYIVTNTEPVISKKNAISGISIASVENMATFLLKTNASPKLNGMNILEFCKLYIEEGAIEGIRGDIAFCQSIQETGWFTFKGDVTPEQMNYAGIGTVGGGAKGHYFSNQREGVRGQIQHLKAYATTEALKQECVDPRYGLVTKGISPNWEELGGRWAVPGYQKSKYNSFDEAFAAGETYGQLILTLYKKMLNTSIDEGLIKPYKKLFIVSVSLNDEITANKCKVLLENNGFSAEIKAN